MIKFISQRIVTDNDEENERIIINGIKRNFGGANFEDVVNTLQDTLQFKNLQDLKSLQPEILIRDNLQESNPRLKKEETNELFESRHLMIITDNQENTLQFIQDICHEDQRQIEIFYGSDFPED